MLAARTIALADVGPGLRAEMFGLFSRYYDHVPQAQFEQDLASKQFVIVLERAGEVVGFTSASVSDHRFEGDDVRVVFSGDTVVDHRHWGQQALAQAWLSEIGRLSRQVDSARIYWFLIVKGHRTYRYLPAFALYYVPRAGTEGEGLLRLRDTLATEKFGGLYDPSTGVARFERSRGQLRSQWAEPSERELLLPEVAFFLKANPGFRNGDELACLAEISRGNMRPLARRWFDQGANGR